MAHYNIRKSKICCWTIWQMRNYQTICNKPQQNSPFYLYKTSRTLLILKYSTPTDKRQVTFCKIYLSITRLKIICKVGKGLRWSFKKFHSNQYHSFELFGSTTVGPQQEKEGGGGRTLQFHHDNAM